MLPLGISCSVRASKMNPKSMPNPSQRQVEMFITQSLMYQYASLQLVIFLSTLSGLKIFLFVSVNKMFSLEEKFIN